MFNKIKAFLRLRPVKLALELAFILLVFMVLKSYMQRGLIDGLSPDIQAQLLSGENVSLRPSNGKPLLLYFWATWCPVCRLSQNGVDAISKNHNVITIAVNSGTVSDITTFLSENKLHFRVINDENETIARQFGVTGVPTSFVIDSRGNILFTDVGFTTSWGQRFRLWFAND